MDFKLKDIEAIYHAALEKQAGPERVGYLESACGDNPALREHVEALLKANEDAGNFLDTPPAELGAALDDAPLTEEPGTVIGRYKLLEKIGEGGMAVVYMAEQTEPIRRKVALKIIKLGMDTKSVIARFEAERQALAMMDHPNIAKVLDAGATETGRPYFVMDLVTGVSITEYCDKNSLSTKERLELFIQVCNAVQHAHQKGIIHRDIKPTNVMVTLHDGKPVPKVIDFGIAKAINQKLTEKTLFTRYAHIIGTPAYMSPEQAELSDLDIDTRTDIYSLGVLLYELLTGTTPFSEDELRKAGYIEMQRVIREQEPVKPSTRIRTSQVAHPRGEGILPLFLMSRASRTRIAGRMPATRKGGTPSPRLLYHHSVYEQVRGDLDWIVMKSLEKDRARRYETANGLALDIRRHIEHEPVLARGPSTTYRLQKFLRRHRSQTIAALAIAVVLVSAGVILSMWNRDRLQLAEAEDFRYRGILSQAREHLAKLDYAAALETINPILDSRHVGPEAQLLYAGILVDNRRSPARDASWRDEGVTILNSLLNEKPEIAGAAQSLLARILYESESPNAEMLKQAEEHHQKAEALLPKTAEAYFLRAMFAITVKDQFAALNKALELDLQHYESRRLRAYTYYASRKYEQMRDDALAMTILRPRDPLGYSLRAMALRELGRYEDSIAEYDHALERTDTDSPQYVDLSVQRSETLLRIGDYERIIAETPMGARDASLQDHLFCALTAVGDYDRASALFRQIVSSGPNANIRFWRWCWKYVLDSLESGRSWHPAGPAPAGAAFLAMMEAEEVYRQWSAKAKRILTNSFTAHWSPDGRKLAFSMGFVGYSGVATYDLATGRTELLIVPGKDPVWSPDGRHIAFVRDCEALHTPEFAGAPGGVDRPRTEEVVWVMKADGSEPKRLADGGWPSWSQDPNYVYYQSRVDGALCSISIADPAAQPKTIMPCANHFPSVSPDERFVAYREGSSLIVRDMESQALVAAWRMGYTTTGGPAWSPAGDELCSGGEGMWVYRFDRTEPVRTLCGPIPNVTSWAPDGTKLAFQVFPYTEIWIADVDRGVSVIDSLGPGRTLAEHCQEMVAHYTHRIEANPLDADAYSKRAGYYDQLHDQAAADADRRRCWATLHPGLPPGFRFAGPWSIMQAIDGPFDYQLVVFLERQEDGMQLLRIAFGQKGRCEMKMFEIPMVVTSLAGLCFFSGLDTAPARADVTFGTPINLGPVVNTSSGDSLPVISADGCVMYFGSNRPGGAGSADVYVTTRQSKDHGWGPVLNIGPSVNSSSAERPAAISADGLSLYLISNRPGGYGSSDLWMTARTAPDAPWATPVNLGPTINTSGSDGWESISADGLSLYFSSVNRPGGFGSADLWVATRATFSTPWGPPANLGPVVNSPNLESRPSISSDGLVLFFASGPPSGSGPDDVCMARRANVSDPWGPPVNLVPLVSTSADDYEPCISADGSTLYFTSNRPGGYGGSDIWQAPILPIVDFNGDGKVDGKDVLCMAAHWGTDDPLCDIGPFAWGDGTVGLEDLTVLAGYLGKEVTDPALIAHWALDEIEGMGVADSAGGNNGYALGNPVWQPDGGQVDGALLFDGVDDFISAPAALNPAEGNFSLLAWVKGGAAGQVAIAQTTAANWLMADFEGKLMTELKGSGRDGVPLLSQTVITDDRWHRIGLVWDGSRRMLYVDGVVAAEDTQSALPNSGNGLYIGAGKGMEPGTFWSGLIDDVRIYNRAVRP